MRKVLLLKPRRFHPSMVFRRHHSHLRICFAKLGHSLLCSILWRRNHIQVLVCNCVGNQNNCLNGQWPELHHIGCTTLVSNPKDRIWDRTLGGVLLHHCRPILHSVLPATPPFRAARRRCLASPSICAELQSAQRAERDQQILDRHTLLENLQLRQEARCTPPLLLHPAPGISDGGSVHVAGFLLHSTPHHTSSQQEAEL